MSGRETLKLTPQRCDVKNSINFRINGKLYTVGGEYELTTSLTEFIRDGAGLKGTKVMCYEGGCGCCTVTVTAQDLVSNTQKTFSINSCLCPLYSVDGWQITTVEGLGSQKNGFHPIQDRVARFNGTQCGYCTPGIVMNMYGLLQENAKPTEQQIEDNFDGNMCRCTGYRPILDAMKSFARDSSTSEGCIDIEDLNKHLCPRTGQPCEEHDDHSHVSTSAGGDSSPGLHIEHDGRHWYQPRDLQSLSAIIKHSASNRVRLVGGNTASGIYKNEGPFDVYVSVCDIKELFTVQVTEASVKIGSGLTLTNLITQLKDIEKQNSIFSYFSIIADFLKKVGNVQLRNVGTWAGNLMMKHDYPEFPSDVFTALEAVGAAVHVFDMRDGSSKSTPLSVFITDVDMKGKIITSLELFKLDEKDRVKMFKIMPRSQNTYAYVNAGFRVKFDAMKCQVLSKPSIVFGGISATLMHATKTEAFLVGKSLTDAVTLKRSLEILKSEINPTKEEVLASPEYRRDLSVNLFYKFVLELCGKELKNRGVDSGSTELMRPLSSGKQSYDKVNKEEWPLKEAMPKVTSHFQASGEAQFVSDIPHYNHELAAALVLTSLGPATINKIDSSLALTLPGVVDFISLKDIPDKGVNTFINRLHFDMAPEEIFCSGDVRFAGQVVGLILAETQSQADVAAEKVEITYSNVQHPVLTVADAIEADSFYDLSVPPIIVGHPQEAFKKAARTVTGECSMESLYHFYLENNVCVCVPVEDGMRVHASTQWPDQLQSCVNLAIGKPFNYVEVLVPRLGGAFGGKCNGIANVTAAVAIAAYKTERPVRCNVNLNTNMQFNGLRFPLFAKYKAGFDESGKIDVIEVESFLNCGHSTCFAFAVIDNIQDQLDNGYSVANWFIHSKAAKTHTPSGQAMRAPGGYPASFIIESIIEHVAKSLNKDPIKVKEMILYKEGQTDNIGTVLTNVTLTRIWSELKQSAEIDKRIAAIEAFNKTNRWKKRGLTMTPEKYGIITTRDGFQCQVSVFGIDGTVSVSQGGVEMGQGLFTKVIQAVAHSFGIPVSMVKVKPVTTQISANQEGTGGSRCSEMCVASAMQCCDVIKERMAPMRSENPDISWPALVLKCYQHHIDLSAMAKAQVGKPDQKYKYYTYAVAAAEVELDVLTGENQIIRVDILFDSGQSLNPDVDVGQIEGGYVMGLGGFLMEKVIRDPNTGRVLNNGTWEYKPPTTKDIPIDFRVKLLSDASNPEGIRGSKACGEPPILLSSGVLFSLKHAVESARNDNTGSSNFITSEAPLTVEKAQLGCGVDISKLVL